MPHEKRSRSSQKLWLYKKKYLSLSLALEVDHQLQPLFLATHFSCGSHRPSLSNLLSHIHLCILGSYSSRHPLFNHRLIQPENPGGLPVDSLLSLTSPKYNPLVSALVLQQLPFSSAHVSCGSHRSSLPNLSASTHRCIPGSKEAAIFLWHTSRAVQ